MTAKLFLNLASLNAHAYRLKRSWEKGRLRSLLHLWLIELEELLPANVRAKLRTTVRTQVLSWPLPNDFDPLRPSVLLLPVSQTMAQQLTLPLAATRDLDSVLGFEIDKYTPFPADQVYFTARIQRKTATHAQVLLVAVQRDRLNTIIAACAAQKVKLRRIDAVDRQNERMGVDLLPADHAIARPALSRIHLSLWLTVFALLLGTMIAVLHKHERLVADMESQVALQRTEAAELDDLRRALNSTQSAARYLSTLKTMRPTRSALIAELSHCLDSDSWIENLEIAQNDQLSFSGLSKKASSLIGQLKACPSLEGVQFQGVIQPEAQSGNERFSIVSRVKQGALP
jgi:general secretion pathway protein L